MFVEHKEALEAAEAPVKITKLSQAIRIGAAMSGQCTLVYTDGLNTCAIGAAYLALGGDPKRLMNTQMDGWQHRSSACLQSPDFALRQIGLSVPDGLTYEVVGRNDRGDTREQIADWLESQGY